MAGLLGGVGRSLRSLFEPTAVHPETGVPTSGPGVPTSGPQKMDEDGLLRRSQLRREVLSEVIYGFLEPPSPHENLEKSFSQLRKVLWRSAVEWGREGPPISAQQSRMLYRYDRFLLW